jgi:hypothetical protein
MTNLIRKYVDRLPIETVRQIAFIDQPVFEKAGVIGDCALRSHVEAAIVAFGDANSPVVIWMDNMAAECCRRLAFEAEPRWNADMSLAPRDGSTIKLWHSSAGVPVQARYAGRDEAPWVEALFASTWGEEAFTCWAEADEAPTAPAPDAPHA